MDGSRFDELTRGLGASGTRRGLLAAAGAVVAAVATALPGSARKKNKGGKPGAEGPCGNGSVKANRCKKNKDCCTGFCDKSKGKGKKQGRCRCKNAGQACTADRNCCSRRGQQMACVAGVCAVPTPPCDACASGCEFETIQAAIDAAEDGGTVTLCAGTYTETFSIVGKSLTIAGAGEGQTILDGDDAGTVISIEAALEATIEIRDLSITGGDGTNGGGVSNDGATTTLRRVTVSGNTATTSGGGISNSGGGALTLDDTTVSGNSTDGNGGGISNTNPGSTTTLTNGSSVAANTADGSGGGIYQTFGTVTIEDGTSVTGNTSVGTGGGVWTNATLDIEPGGSVANNTPTNCAGGGTITGTCVG